MSLKMESSAMEYNIGSLPSTHLTGMINDFNRIIKQKKWSVTKYLSNIFARSFTDERMAYVLTTKVSCAERNNISINGVYAIKKKSKKFYANVMQLSQKQYKMMWESILMTRNMRSF